MIGEMAPIHRFPRIPILLLVVAAWVSVHSCRSTTDLVLDDPAFLGDMVDAALAGEEFEITPEDFGGIRRLLRSENSDYRRAGVILAVQSGAGRLRPDILRAALDAHPAVAAEAGMAIRSDPDAFRNLVFEEARNGDAAVRAGALSLVPLVGGADSVPFLIELFSDPDPRVRESASRAVRALADRRNPELRAALGSPDPVAASIAYRTLGRYGDPDDAPVFTGAFTSEHPEVRREAQLAAFALGESGLPHLHVVAADPARDVRSRMAAIDVIQGIRSPNSLPLLIGLLGDPSERISGRAEAVLGTYGNEAIPVLEELYRESSVVNRLHAVRLMGEIGSPAALPVLASALDDPSAEVRREARAVLESFGERSRPEVRRILLAGGLRGRREALALLRDTGDPWLVTDEEGRPNQKAALLLITLSDAGELREYLEASGASRLKSETILSLKDAWEIGEEFAELEALISSGADPYLLAWKRRETYAVAAREALRESFAKMHEYFDSRDPGVLLAAEAIRAESRALEERARMQKEAMDAMDPAVRQRGSARLERYRELREELVRTWEYVVPELRALAESVYDARGLDPEALAKESALLD